MNKSIHYGFLSATALSGAVFLGHLSTYSAFTGGVWVLLGAAYVFIALFGFWCVAMVKSKHHYMTSSQIWLAFMPALAIAVLVSVAIGLGIWTGA